MKALNELWFIMMN